MTCGLEHASCSLPEWQDVKLTFLAPCICVLCSEVTYLINSLTLVHDINVWKRRIKNYRGWIIRLQVFTHFQQWPLLCFLHCQTQCKRELWQLHWPHDSPWSVAEHTWYEPHLTLQTGPDNKHIQHNMSEWWPVNIKYFSITRIGLMIWRVLLLSWHNGAVTR